MQQFHNSNYSMKVKKFLWAAVIWAVLVLVLYFLSLPGSNAKSKLGFFPLFMIVWALVSVLSILVLLLRLFKKFRYNGSFFYVFLAEANLVLASYGFYQILSPNARENLYAIILVFAVNVLMALLILRDYFTMEG